jgi:hypothetical protein
MKSGLNRINGQYLGDSKLIEDVGIQTINKSYNRLLGTEWIRPNEWLPRPDLTGITQSIIGLLAIIPGFNSGHTGITSNSNFVGFLARGAYNVDWGDGTTSSHADNTVASKQYNFYSLPDANLTAEGYKQVWVRITPQTGNLTQFSINQKANISGITLSIGAHNFLEFVLKTPFLASVNNSVISTSSFGMCKSIEFIGRTLLTTGSLFAAQSNLENVGGFEWNLNYTNFGTYFLDNRRLKTIPLLNTENLTTVDGLFNSCFQLKIVPPLNFSNITIVGSAFNSTRALQTIPFLNTEKTTNLSSCFFNCSSLQKIPEIETKNVTNMNQMFQGARSLEKIHKMNFSNLLNANNMFNSNTSLKTIPEFDFSNCFTVTSIFDSCTSLEKIPNLNFSSLRGVCGSPINIFSGCNSLWKSGLLTFGTGFTQYTNLFNGTRLTMLDGISAANGTCTGTTFPNLTNGAFFPSSLRVGPVYNAGRSISYATTSLSPTALNEVFTGLATLSGVSATINITNVWGSSGCNRTIATSKGWTVIG